MIDIRVVTTKKVSLNFSLALTAKARRMDAVEELVLEGRHPLPVQFFITFHFGQGEKVDGDAI